MAIDEVPRQEPTSSFGTSSHTGMFVAIFVLLAALAAAQIYTVWKMGEVRTSLETQQAEFQKTMSARMEQQAAARVESSTEATTEELEAMRKDIDDAKKRSGAASSELRKARALVTQLQVEHRQSSEMLQSELAKKASQDDVGSLSQNVSATRTDLDSTRQLLDTTRADLGMARSELGTLIARNSDEIETLRKLGERDYFEFTAEKGKPVKVANVGLVLKKANTKRHRFNLALLADDMEVEKKDRTVNEPVFFYLKGQKKFYELVVNKVESNSVKGYISTPKGAIEMASR
jgi:Skp family chaperone for outer membrane proteins